jgi:hypothetical protein
MRFLKLFFLASSSSSSSWFIDSFLCFRLKIRCFLASSL